VPPLHSDGRPRTLIWNYDRTELITDAIVHIAGLGLALAGIVNLFLLSHPFGLGLKAASFLIYGAGLIAMLGCSAAYNLWPVSPRKWWLRRFDQCAIFIFIAATYTPLIAQLNLDDMTLALLIGIWAVAGLGATFKLAWPGRFDRVSIFLCLLLGSSGVLVFEPAILALSTSTLWLIVVGWRALFNRGHFPYVGRAPIPEFHLAYTGVACSGLPLHRNMQLHCGFECVISLVERLHGEQDSVCHSLPR
jgi:hemolysin III